MFYYICNVSLGLYNMKLFNIAIRILVFSSLILVALSCVREDDEPQPPENSISRLYVSFSDFQTNDDLDPFENVIVIDPADSDGFRLGPRHTSEAKGGSAIHFNPYSRSVFQSGINVAGTLDTAIYVMAVANTGILSNTGKILNPLLRSVRGLVYHPEVDNLYAVNLNDSTVYVFNRPGSLNRFAEPTQTIKLNSIRPWSASMIDKDLYLTKTGADGGVAIIKDIVDKREEFIELNPDHIISIPGANNIRGMSYDERTDVMVLTDYNSSEGEGRILIIESFSSKIDNGTVNPDRVVEGSNTLLQEPTDVAIDMREGAQYFYVADQQAMSIFRFDIGGQGNIAPEKVLRTSPRTPVGLSLDARGPVSVEPSD